MEPVTTLVGLKTETSNERQTSAAGAGTSSPSLDECEISLKEAEWIERDCRIDRTIDAVVASVTRFGNNQQPQTVASVTHSGPLPTYIQVDGQFFAAPQHESHSVPMGAYSGGHHGYIDVLDHHQQQQQQQQQQSYTSHGYLSDTRPLPPPTVMIQNLQPPPPMMQFVDHHHHQNAGLTTLIPMQVNLPPPPQTNAVVVNGGGFQQQHHHQQQQQMMDNNFPSSSDVRMKLEPGKLAPTSTLLSPLQLSPGTLNSAAVSLFNDAISSGGGNLATTSAPFTVSAHRGQPLNDSGGVHYVKMEVQPTRPMPPPADSTTVVTTAPTTVSTVEMANDLIATMLSGEQPTAVVANQSIMTQSTSLANGTTVTSVVDSGRIPANLRQMVTFGLQSPSISSSSHFKANGDGSFVATNNPTTSAPVIAATPCVVTSSAGRKRPMRQTVAAKKFRSSAQSAALDGVDDGGLQVMVVDGPNVDETPAVDIEVGSGAAPADDIYIDTRELCQRIAYELKQHSIPQAVFAERILGRSQGTLSDLLRNPKPWNKLKSGRETFRRMYSWLKQPLTQRLAVLELWKMSEMDQQPAQQPLANMIAVVTAAAADVSTDDEVVIDDDDDEEDDRRSLSVASRNDTTAAVVVAAGMTQSRSPSPSTSPNVTGDGWTSQLLLTSPDDGAEAALSPPQPSASRHPLAKRPRLVFSDIQKRTLQAIFKETQRPSREMQQTIAEHLGLDLSTVANFFMNARRRSRLGPNVEDAPAPNQQIRAITPPPISPSRVPSKMPKGRPPRVPLSSPSAAVVDTVLVPSAASVVDTRRIADTVEAVARAAAAASSDSPPMTKVIPIPTATTAADLNLTATAPTMAKPVKTIKVTRSSTRASASALPDIKPIVMNTSAAPPSKPSRITTRSAAAAAASSATSTVDRRTLPVMALGSPPANRRAISALRRS